MSTRIDVATRKGLFTFRRGAAGWDIDRVAFLGNNLSMSLVDQRDGAAYAAVDEGHFGCHLHRSRDYGATWEEIAAPAFPAGATVIDRMPTEPGGDDEPVPRKPAALSEIWSLEPGGPDEPGVLWCGTIPGALFRSDDHGDTWRLVDSLWDRAERDQWFGGGKDDPGVHSIVVDPRDPLRLALGVSCGGVWTSNDGGANWSNDNHGLRADFMPPDMQYSPVSQDPHRMVGCRANPDRLWIQHHNGVFRSDNAGATWTEIESVTPSVFGFAVAVHPNDPDTAWFVPAVKDESRYPVDAALAVAKTTDGGATFTALRAGLPQRHAYDIVFRHALDVDDTGDQLAFGSSTGGFWTSDNGGESWSHVAAHLPPIYSVRFA
ncbi:WD40/YVTN/BNR-like repeat-containing protein [Botrimarina colliarenosi]|uniref:WD40/YVTN/BNR-like repeat-containing protein n=1 Tax=Botrimarina colliarenosi TaxID=2528001 RepID=UPI0011B79E4F|nr:exo-alpha-sialidase [Botrimarina colliarenosi]